MRPFIQVALVVLINTAAFTSASAQADCRSILKKAIAAYDGGTGNLDKALQYLQDTEVCDYRNILQKERQTLQKKIFQAIKKQKEQAEASRVEADLASIEALKAERKAAEERKIAEELRRIAEENAIRDSLLILYFEADPSKMSPIEKIKYLEDVVQASNKRYSKTLEFCHFELAEVYENMGIDSNISVSDSSRLEFFFKAEFYYKSLLSIINAQQVLNIYERLASFYRRRNMLEELKSIEIQIGKNVEEVFAFNLIESETVNIEGKSLTTITINDDIYKVTFHKAELGVSFSGEKTVGVALQKEASSFSQFLPTIQTKLIKLLAEEIPPFDAINTSLFKINEFIQCV